MTQIQMSLDDVEREVQRLEDLVGDLQFQLDEAIDELDRAKGLLLAWRVFAGEEVERPKQPTAWWAGPDGTKPTLTDGILRYFKTFPARLSTDAASALAGVVVTDANDPKKMIRTRIGQLVKENRLVKDPDGLIRLAALESNP